tara:strand:- start:1624 stop:1938 length:315 start_codon:yes stop_codon:yes gene_type:complete
MPKRRKNYPTIKKYILALSQIVPNKTELQEFLEVLCALLHEAGIHKTQRGGVSPIKSLRSFCVNVLKNDNWGTKIIEYDKYYAMDGIMLKKTYQRTILIKTQEE